MVDSTPIEDAQPVALEDKSLEDKLKDLFAEEAADLVANINVKFNEARTNRLETENR